MIPQALKALGASPNRPEPIRIDYVAEPTAARFHASPARVRGLMGPIGAGKTVACVQEILRLALSQSVYRGVRSTRVGIIRNTYPELRTTTLRTWMDWIPSEITYMRWDAPITAHVRVPDIGDGTGLDLEALFIALDRPAHVRKLKSLELTHGWINEASEIPFAVLEMLGGRIGRYPGKLHGGLVRDSIVLDTNPPPEDHWWYRLAEDERPASHAFFRQPPAVRETKNGQWEINPEAENLRHQPKGGAYWLDQIPGRSHEWIKVFLQGEYGSVEEGRPVWPEYSATKHLSDTTLQAHTGLPLILGWDFGLTPACAICQLDLTGRFRVLAELHTDRMGIRKFSRTIVLPFLAVRYPQRSILSYGDPAGAASAQTDESTCFQELAAAGIPTIPTITNDFGPRRDAVANFLDREGGFALDPSCRRLRLGMGGRYKLRRVQTPGETVYSDRPIKNEYSHICDALQYAALGASTVELHRPPTAGHRRARSWRAL